MCGSLVPDTLHSIWNPSAAQLPLLLLMFVAWSVACGDHRLLPLGVLLGSFAVQCHLTYVPPVLAMAAVALVGLRVAARERGEVAAGSAAQRQDRAGRGGGVLDRAGHRPAG